MQPIYNKIFLEHKAEGHPERPERLLAFGDLEQSEIENGEKYLTKALFPLNYIIPVGLVWKWPRHENYI